MPGGTDGKESACNLGDLGSIPGLGRSPGGGHGNPLQYSCLENEQLSMAQHGTYIIMHDLDLLDIISCCIVQWSLEELFVKPPMDGYFIMN